MRNNRAMKFNRDAPTAVTIRHVEKGMLKVGAETVTESVVLFRDSVQRSSVAADISRLTVSDLQHLIDAGPEIIIVGTGWTQSLPPRELVFALAKNGIGFEVMDTPAACRTFNILVSEDRDVAAVLAVD